MSVYLSHCIVNPLQSGCKMLPMNVKCKTQNLFQKEKKSFRTLQLHRVVGAVHLSAQCKVPRIYEHQPWSHIHLDSHISAHTCSHQFTSAHHCSYLLTSRWSNTNQHFLIPTQLCSSARSHIHLESRPIYTCWYLLTSTHICSHQLIYMLTSTHICSHQLISAHHFSYLLRSSCSNFLISTNIFLHLLTSGHIGSDFQLLAITHTRSYQLTFTHFWQHSSRKWFVCMAWHN